MPVWEELRPLGAAGSEGGFYRNEAPWHINEIDGSETDSVEDCFSISSSSSESSSFDYLDAGRVSTVYPCYTPRNQSAWTTAEAVVEIALEPCTSTVDGSITLKGIVEHYNGSTWDTKETIFTTSPTSTLTRTKYSVTLSTSNWGGTNYPDLDPSTDNFRIRIKMYTNNSTAKNHRLRVYLACIRGSVDSTTISQTVTARYTAGMSRDVSFGDIWNGNISDVDYYFLGFYNDTSANLVHFCFDMDNDPSFRCPDPSASAPTITIDRYNSETITKQEMCVNAQVSGWVDDDCFGVVTDGTTSYNFWDSDTTDPTTEPNFQKFSIGASATLTDWYVQIGGANSKGDDSVYPILNKIFFFITFDKTSSGPTIKDGAATIDGEGALVVTGSKRDIVIDGAATLAGTSGLDVTGSLYQAVKNAAITLAGTSTFEATAFVTVDAAVVMAGAGSLALGTVRYEVTPVDGFSGWQWTATITGAEDGLEDLVISVEVVAAHARNGTPSYMRVDAPGTRTLYDAIQARKNGDLVLSGSAITERGLPVEFNDLLAVNIGDIGFARSGSSGQVTISGTRQKTIATIGRYNATTRVIEKTVEGDRARLVLPYDPAIGIDQDFSFNGVNYSMDEINILINEKEALMTLKGIEQ